MSNNKDTVSPSQHLIGRVKWFNNKAGYGFITVTDGSRAGNDVFVHHSVISVENQQYKYLVQGEYVEFELVKTDSKVHEWQASNVSGINGGKLMCETRRELKIARNEYKTTRSEQHTSNEVSNTRPREQPRETQPRETQPRQRTSAPRVRGEGPRESDSKEWNLKERKPRKNSSTQGTTSQSKKA